MKLLFFLLAGQLFAAEPTCQIMGGEYHGIVQQNQSRQWQWIKVSLTAARAAMGACDFQGEVELVWGNEAHSNDRKRFQIPKTTRTLPGKREDFFVLLSTEERDGVLLELIVTPKGFSAGNIYSKVLGFLGSLRIAKGIPQKSSAQFVPSLSGSYAPEIMEGLRLRLEIDHTSNGVGKQGEIIDSSSGADVPTDTVYTVTHDTQSGWVTIETENRLLVGYTSPHGLQLFNPMSNNVGPCPHCTGSRLFSWNRLKHFR